MKNIINRILKSVSEIEIKTAVSRFLTPAPGIKRKTTITRIVTPAPGIQSKTTDTPNLKPLSAAKRETVIGGKLKPLSGIGIKTIITRIFKSIFRRDFSGTSRDDALRIANNFFLHLHPVKVRKHAVNMRYTFCLGGGAFGLFIILAVTGILLMFYYHPSVPTAYFDMKDLEFVVSSGVFLRNLHRWSAHAMVAFVFLHMCRVFYTGAYKPPREFNWVIGIILLLSTCVSSFTGYLLPWDQLAYWGITVGTTIAGYAPLVGEKIRFILLGGNIVSENALLRFYVLHCFVIPLIVSLLMGVHFWRIRKDGGISGPL